MERITEMVEDIVTYNGEQNEYLMGLTAGEIAAVGMRPVVKDILKLLAEYEDTGLTPNGVMLIQAENADLQRYCEENYNRAKEAESKVEELKARLDKAVELPCAVGDMVYMIAKCENFKPQLDGTMWDSSGGFGTATGYYCPYEGCCPFETDDCDAVKNEFAVFFDEVKGIHIEEDIYFCCEYGIGFDADEIEIIERYGD